MITIPSLQDELERIEKNINFLSEFCANRHKNKLSAKPQNIGEDFILAQLDIMRRYSEILLLRIEGLK